MATSSMLYMFILAIEICEEYGNFEQIRCLLFNI